MTTLTQYAALQSDHCPHKLPTSCRLTARPICCACQDNRRHAEAYRRYIDGVGFVMLGTRQDGYCWPCRVFWDTRTVAADMSSHQARIPFIPDQHDFVNTWHDWHRGYRTVLDQDGSETIQPLVGQPLNEVSIGHLPISSDGSDSYDPSAVRWIPSQPIPQGLFPEQRQQQQEVVPIADEDRLFDSEEEEEVLPFTSEDRLPDQEEVVARAGEDRTAIYHPQDTQNPIPQDADIDPFPVTEFEGDEEYISSALSTADHLSTEFPPLNSHITPYGRRIIRNILQRIRRVLSSLTLLSRRLQRVFDHLDPASPSDAEMRLTAEAFKINLERLARRARLLLRHIHLQRSGRRTTAIESTSIQATIPSGTESMDPNGLHNAPDHQSSELPVALSSGSSSHEGLGSPRSEVGNELAPLGTREEVQQPEYQSPLRLMFARATARGERLMMEHQAHVAMLRRQEIIRELQERILDYSRELTPPPATMYQVLQAWYPLTETTSVTDQGDWHVYESSNTHLIQNRVRAMRGTILRELLQRIPIPEQSHPQLHRDNLDAAVRDFLRNAAGDNSTDETTDRIMMVGMRSTDDLILSILGEVVPRLDHQTVEAYVSEFPGITTGSDTLSTSSLAEEDLLEDMTRPPAGSFLVPQSDPLTTAPAIQPSSGPSTTPDGLEWLETEAESQENHLQILAETFGRINASLIARQNNAQQSNTRQSNIQQNNAQQSNTQQRIVRQSDVRLEPPVHVLTPEETMVQLLCTICREQIADIALVPCGHLIMCRWCSETHAHLMSDPPTTGRGICPLCRAPISRRLRIWGLDRDERPDRQTDNADSSAADVNAG